MSAFLGPIHYWLYNKIKIQNSITTEILHLSEELNLNYRETIDNKYGKIEIRPLEEVIDTNNIHGWLQECIRVVEYRLAFVVTRLLQEKPEVIDALKKIYKNTGIKLSSVDKNSTVSEIFKAAITDSLLDGMPCDHVNVVESEDDEQEIVWKRNQCVHKEFWESVGGDVKNYYLLRDEYINGFIQNTDAIYEKIDDSRFKIYRK